MKTVTPYAGTEGYSGSEGSYLRALEEVASGKAGARQRAIGLLLANNGRHGATWSEVASALGIHHGSATGSLSSLHKAGKIACLLERRGRSSIYVRYEFVAGRPVREYRPNRKTCPNCGQ